MFETISIVLAVLTLVWAFVVVSRLNEIATNTRRISEHLFGLRHPEIPWPKPAADLIVYEKTGDNGRHYRLRANGQWEVSRWWGGWKPLVADQAPDTERAD